jgi:hypothetical protein
MSIRPFVIAAATITILIWVWRSRQRGKWLEAVPPLGLLLHIIAFFTCAALKLLPAVDLNFWSGVIYIHTIILIGSYAVLDER